MPPIIVKRTVIAAHVSASVQPTTTWEIVDSTVTEVDGKAVNEDREVIEKGFTTKKDADDAMALMVVV